MRMSRALLGLVSLVSRSNVAAAFQAPISITNHHHHRGGHQQLTKRFCGLIAAIDDVWSPHERPSTTSYADVPLLQDKAVLTHATNVLYHRGPDGYMVGMGTTTTTNTNSKQGQVARWSMGHTRLAIVDPENRNADQPFHFTFGSKKIHLVANGEIYNHEKLYAELVENGWPHERYSLSDCEVIAHAYAMLGGPVAIRKLDGMYAFTIIEEDLETGETRVFAGRDCVGIKPIYMGKTTGASNKASAYVFASELKALTGHVDPSTVSLIPSGHYWSPEEGITRYYSPEWLDHDYAPWELDGYVNPTNEEIAAAFTKAIDKRMMADVDYGFFLSGGVDSCCVAHDLLPLYRASGDDRPIKTYTVGMEGSPDVMAARGMVEALGGPKYVDHKVRTFTPDEVFDLIPKIIYHMETYEAELIRSSIPNWLLAERAAHDVKMVLTGEGADELFAGYLYFKDAPSPNHVQNELRRIYSMLGNVNLHRTDRMTMAHGLEARVPFLDTEFTKLVMSVDPAMKVVDPVAVQNNARGREKTMLREIFEGPNANGHSIPRPVLWRAKAMQCEGVGQDWVSILQRKISSFVSDAEMTEAPKLYPLNTPQTKEELYYRKIYDSHFHGMEHVVNLWEGGGRAMGAAWKSDMYTREGLANTDLLKHALQTSSALGASGGRSTSNIIRPRNPGFIVPRGGSNVINPRRPDTRLFYSTEVDTDGKASLSDMHCKTARDAAVAFGYSEYEAMLTSGGDDRSLILPESGANKYHIKPQPIDSTHIFRGSCTGNPPTRRGYEAAKKLFETKLSNGTLKDEKLDEAVAAIFEDQRNRIHKLLNLPEGSEVVICPSGSDAEYIPVAIAKALHPKKDICNFVSQVKEIGAGSAPAAKGEYFSSHAPLLGKVPSNMKTLAGFEEGIDSVEYTARKSDGSPVDALTGSREFMKKCHEEGRFPIVHGVFGGKTGMRCEEMPGSLDSGKTSLGIVDACQARFSQAELQQWLDNDSIVLFTSSKFYQAPPFCAAVIIPESIATQLHRSPRPKPAQICSTYGLGGFITDKELPECLHNWKECLKKDNTTNVGLALRWQAGLAGMEALAHVSDEKRTEAVTEWASSVTRLVANEDNLDPWSVERSIVSIRVAKNGGGGWLNMVELRHLFRWMSMDVSTLVPDASEAEKKALSQVGYIGQPVDVAESHGIVRIALGVESLLSYLDNKEKTLVHDELIVQKIAAIGKHFDTLLATGL